MLNSKKEDKENVEKQRNKISGIGLNNVMKRLELFYGENNYTLKINENSKSYKVSLELKLSDSNDKLRL